jgi:putative photosynthetic complex assembly protein 2
MNDHVQAALFVLGVWWLSTAIVLGMVWLRRSTFRVSVAAVSAVAVAGLYGLLWSSRHETAAAAYVAFSAALAVWAWHELTFLLGIVTGPRKAPCPPDAQGWRRFGFATAAVIHHEVALALTLVAIVALTAGQPNQVGMWTFLVLWIMRLSAKLNLFLGVRNLTEEFIPEHLRYLVSYFRRARLNALMPVSIVAASAVVVRLAAESLSDGATTFVLVGRTLVATLLMLAVVEHVFLAVPVPDAVLWRWAIRSPRSSP